MFKKKVNFDYPFIDIHCHLIYNVDDGPKNIETSIKMLEIAYNENIHTIIATPHFHPAKGTDSFSKYSDKFVELKKEAYKISKEFNIYCGREIYYISDIIDLMDKRDDLYMNYGMYILVEYAPNVEKSYLYNSINEILSNSKVPIIAHIERYFNVINDLDFIESLKNVGAIIQINASSVTGQSGSEIKSMTKKLLKYNFVDVISTDAHSAGTRSPKMLECMEYVANKYGVKYAKKISHENPLCILENRDII